MNYNLTYKYKHSEHGKDGTRKSYFIWFLNDVQILKQKKPFDENAQNGFNGIWSIKNVYLLNNNLYQTRYDGKKTRNVKYPISKKILSQFNIPNNIKIKKDE